MAYHKNHYPLDFQATVNPVVLQHLKAPWNNKRSKLQEALYTSEYQRQFSWKFPVPTVYKTTWTGKEVNEIDHITPLAPPVPVKKPVQPSSGFQDEAAQTERTERSERVTEREAQTSDREVRQDEATQTNAIAVDVSVSTSSLEDQPVRKQHVTVGTSTSTEQPEKEKVKTVDRTHLKTANSIFAREEPERIASNGDDKEHEHQMLSYGWAHKDYFNDNYDMKTFNVKQVPQHEERTQRLKTYQEQTEGRRRRRAQTYADNKRYKSTPNWFGTPFEQFTQTEYQSQYRNWGKSIHPKTAPVYSGKTNYYADEPSRQLQPTDFRLRKDRFAHAHTAETEADAVLRTEQALKSWTARAKPPSNAYAWLNRMSGEAAAQTELEEREEVDSDGYRAAKYMAPRPETTRGRSTQPRALDHDDIYEAPPIRRPSTASPQSTTYDKARELLSRALSRSSRY